MKKLLIVMMVVVFVSANVAVAADVVTYESKKGTVTFNHKAHQERLDGCAKCHDGEPVKIEVNKVYGHKSCKSCHKEMSGPTKCNECHVK